MINFSSRGRQSTVNTEYGDGVEEEAEGQLICRVSCESIRDAAASNRRAGVLFVLETVKKTLQVFIAVVI